MSVYVCQNYWIELSALTANKALVWGFQTVDPDTNHIPEASAGVSTVTVHLVVVVGSPKGGFDFILMRILWSWRSPGKGFRS